MNFYFFLIFITEIHSVMRKVVAISVWKKNNWEENRSDCLFWLPVTAVPFLAAETETDHRVLLLPVNKIALGRLRNGQTTSKNPQRTWSWKKKSGLANGLLGVWSICAYSKSSCLELEVLSVCRVVWGWWASWVNKWHLRGLQRSHQALKSMFFSLQSLKLLPHGTSPHSRYVCTQCTHSFSVVTCV